MSKIAALFLCLLVWLPVFAQRKVDDANSYHRVICVVPLIGSGSWADPIRPMFAPLPSQMGRGKSGILAYYHELTDDGKAAIVVFVAQDRATLQPILTSTAAGVKAFDISGQLLPATPITGGIPIAPHATSPVATGTPVVSGIPAGLPAGAAGIVSTLQAVQKNFDWTRFALRVQ